MKKKLQMKRNETWLREMAEKNAKYYFEGKSLRKKTMFEDIEVHKLSK